MTTIYRVQDKEGRGPWRLGFSDKWVEYRDDHENLLPWMAEFGRVDRMRAANRCIGCGCRTLEQLRRWFTPSEYATLRRFGYAAVSMAIGRVLAESDTQLVFERALPLREGVEPIELYAAVFAESPAGEPR